MRVRHKGLRALAEQNQARQLPQDLVPKLKRVLTLLDEARHPGDLAEQPGYRLHPLKGDMAGLWSIRVSGNWRVVFGFEDSEAVDVDLVDYH
ncbi:MAG: type II toxin-antitoxin system mRNA interferase toxin, RelE/StbE family [Gammaproteobacteria bacterium]|nr:type II toxin-antitoxin system mRNA interferase toxin, RelE/StbE family [Gammaproteobacteria bacterium]